eukprot:1967083-Ditylum_brightwellii.AAC.1
MVPRHSKAVDMRFHWLKCQEAQRQFDIKWKRGAVNKANYHSNYHPPVCTSTSGHSMLSILLWLLGMATLGNT